MKYKITVSLFLARVSRLILNDYKAKNNAILHDEFIFILQAHN